MVTDPFGQHGMGGARGNEGNAFFLKQWGGCHYKSGVSIPDAGHNVIGQRLFGTGGRRFLIGLGIDADDFQIFAEKPTLFIDQFGL